MNFVFEYIDEIDVNFIKCPDVNPSGIRRFTPSPFVIHLQKLASQTKLIEVQTTKTPIEYPYIIASGVGHSPDNWTGDWQYFSSDRRSVFHWLSPQYLKDLQNNRAYLLLDQSHEGYQTEWLWDWFHANCTSYLVSPDRVIYVTGNLNSEEQYRQYADSKGLSKRITVIGYPHFEVAMSIIADNKNPPSFKQQKRFKSENLDSIKLYNCLQKRPRNHRAWMFNNLYHRDLLNDGINSMNYFTRTNSFMDGKTISEKEYNNIVNLLPMLPPTDTIDNLPGFESHDCGNYLENFNSEITLNSWISIISEASFNDNELTCFISEKTFKMIASNHPFIIFGNRYSLKRLKELGYQTFHPWINEEYDELPNWDRLNAILKELQRLKSMSQEKKLIWYHNLKPILIHNSTKLKEVPTEITPALKKFLEKIKKDV